jgi:GT2 family glycosyltransferase
MSKNAILITVHNRKEKTMRCLRSLFDNIKDVDIFLVDDQSTDGTADEVKAIFPSVHVITSNGNLFWNRGMHLAWSEASKNQYDFYVWLNNDVVLYENAFKELFACASLTNHSAIISGLIQSHDEQAIIYGGTDETKKIIATTNQLNAITHMNGNVVLVPKSVFAILGNLDPFYHHDLGDVDYGLRAQKKQIGVYTTRTPIASCERNDVCRVRLNHSTITKRFKRLYSPLGSKPSINFYFRKQHYGLWHALLYCLNLFFINTISDSVNQFMFGEKYQ